jgi:nickel-type superoxide dismutase maturation protease
MARPETRLILLALIACWAWRRLDRLVVSGVSMTPTLYPGDQLLLLRTRHARAGDLVVVRDPREPSREVVKRLVRVTAEGDLVVAGDNPEMSTDSRIYGPVPRDHLVGRAVPVPKRFGDGRDRRR